MNAGVVIALSFFGASILGLVLLFAYKINRLRREEEIFLDRINDFADRNFRKGIVALLEITLKTRSKIFNRRNAVFLAQIAGAVLAKTYVFTRRNSRKIYRKWSNVIAGKRLIRGKEKVSAFLKDVVDFKNGLRKEDEEGRD